jgi:hypothetical protein
VSIDPKTKKLLKNQGAFDKSIGEIIVKEDIDTFAVPKVINSGKVGDQFYLIEQYFEGILLAEKFPAKVNSLPAFWETIAYIILF